MIVMGDESLEHYVYDYIEIQIWKSIHLPKFESPPENQQSQIRFSTFDTSTLEVVNRNLNIYPNKYIIANDPFVKIRTYQETENVLEDFQGFFVF